MKVVYSVVDSGRHTTHGYLARTWSGHFFWDKTEELRSDHAVLASRRDGHLVGILKYDFAVHGRHRILSSHATFVWPLYRGINIAQGLWAEAIDEHRVTKVRVNVVSDRGKTLVETLSDQFPSVMFEMVESGQRALRSLKGAKGAKGRRAA